MKEDRFIIIDKSDSGHCCFECSIVDTSFGKENYSTKENVYWKKSICETLYKEDAVLICDALNNYIKENKK